MGQVYLDNAATTVLDESVKKAMMEAMDSFGNPSSVHSAGRKSKAIIESTRTQISKYFTCQPGEITFTSGGTEANNLAILGTVETGAIETIISSKIEHPSVLESIKKAEELFKISVLWVSLLPNGAIDLNNLELLLSQNPKALVSLMTVNNEIGNILDIQKVGEICRNYQAIFHTDAVQAVGHIDFDLSKLSIDLLTCSAHKLHGPKGTGFLFHRKGVSMHPQINGGAQERDFRGGTENLVGIAGFGKALDLVYENWEESNQKIAEIKAYFLDEIKTKFPEIAFNGASSDLKNSVNSIVSINFPEHDTNEMLLFQFDLKGIQISGGSACSSGSLQGSHVLNQLGVDGASVRISFSKFNSKADVDCALSTLKDILEV